MVGPVGSVMLHVVLIAVLLKVLVFEGRKNESTVEVRVLNVPQKILEPVQQEQLVEAESLSEDISRSQELEDFFPDEVLEEMQSDPLLEQEQLKLVSNIKSPLVMKGLMAGRSEKGRAKLLREYGGRYGSRAEIAVLRSLDWIMSVQTENGSWGISKSRSMTAKQERARLTGLALLAYLAHGETPQSEKYGACVQRAIQYLLDQLHAKHGRTRHIIKPAGRFFVPFPIIEFSQPLMHSL